jgi:sugar phosphate isomerase/epimerase
MSPLPIAVFTASLPGPLDQALERAAALGLAGVQIPAEAVDDPDRLRATLAGHGLLLTALCGDLPGHGFTRREGLEGRLAATRAIIDRAAALGTTVVSAHVGVIPADPAQPRTLLLAEALVAIADHARDRGVRYAIETGPEPATVLRSFLDRLGHPALGANLDPANLAMVQGEDGAAATAALAPWIAHVHAKDGVRHQPCEPEAVYAAFADGGFAALVARTGALFSETPLGAGQVGWPGVLRELRRAGYRGALTIERECGNDPAGDIAAAARFLSTLQETAP